MALPHIDTFYPNKFMLKLLKIKFLYSSESNFFLILEKLKTYCNELFFHTEDGAM